MFLIVIGHQSIHNRMREGFVSQVPNVYYDILLCCMIDLSPSQPWLGAILTIPLPCMYCDNCERGCVTASNQSVYDFEGCVAEYVHASHASK